MKDIRVEAIEDIRGFLSGVSTERKGNLIAKKGREGRIGGMDAKRLSKDYPYDYVDVLFDGNKNMRNVPTKSLKIVEENIIFEREVEQCLFYRANIKNSFNDWKSSMKRLGFSDKSINKATKIIQENNWECNISMDK